MTNHAGFAGLHMIKADHRRPGEHAMTGFTSVGTFYVAGRFSGRRYTVMATDTSCADKQGMIKTRRRK